MPQPLIIRDEVGQERDVTFGDTRWGRCDCGCNAYVSNHFSPGHDAKLKARLVRFAQCGTVEQQERARAALQARGWLRFLAGTTEYESARTVQRARRQPIDVTSRTFGVEIEFTGISKQRAFEALRDAGITVRSETYNHRTRSYWKIITDNSVMEGFECVSPVLRGEPGFAQLRIVCDALREAGATVNRSCGTHVHHGVQDLNGQQLGRLIEFYSMRQSALSSLVAASRRGNNTYCMPWPADELQRVMQEFAENRRPSHWTRFRTINVMSFPKYGTIEIRQHQGTLAAKKIEHWTRLGQAMIEAVKTGRAVRTDLVGMLADLDLPDETRSHHVQRARDLGTHVPPTPWEVAA